MKFIIFALLFSLNTFANEDGLRSLWALNHHELLKENKRYVKRLVQKFERGQIIGLELVTAASTDSKIESKFGHSMLRFVDTTASQSDDLTLSFVADIDDRKMSYTGGIFGKYPVFPLIKPTRSFVRDYIKLQGRYLKRNIIPSTLKQREDLIYQLKKWWNEIEKKEASHYQEELRDIYKKATKFGKKKYGEGDFALIPLVSYENENQMVTSVIVRNVKDPEEQKVFHLDVKAHKVKGLGKYTFLSNNCAGALYRFLKNNGFPYKSWLGISGRVPSKLAKRLEKSLLNPYKELKIDKLLILLNEYKSIIENKKFEILNRILSVEQKALLLDFKLIMPEQMKQSWRSLVREERFSYDQLHGLVSAPISLYGLCSLENLNCHKQVLSDLKAAFLFPNTEKRERIIKYSKRNRRGLRKSPIHREHHKWLSKNY